MEGIKGTLKKIGLGRGRLGQLVKAVLVLAIGAILIAVPTESAGLLYGIAGGIMIAIGLILVIRCFMSPKGQPGGSLVGTALMMMGLYCVIHPEAMTTVQNLILGVFLALDGMLAVESAVPLVKGKARGWLLLLIGSLLVVAMGIFVMLSPYSFMALFAGIAMAFDGAFDLVRLIFFERRPAAPPVAPVEPEEPERKEAPAP